MKASHASSSETFQKASLAAAVTSFLSSSHLTKESGKCNLRDLQ